MPDAEREAHTTTGPLRGVSAVGAGAEEAGSLCGSMAISRNFFAAGIDAVSVTAALATEAMAASALVVPEMDVRRQDLLSPD